jgi:hypothetical protein
MVRLSPSIVQSSTPFDTVSDRGSATNPFNSIVAGDGFPLDSAARANTPNDEIIHRENAGTPAPSPSPSLASFSSSLSSLSLQHIANRTRQLRDFADFAFRNPKSVPYDRIIKYCFIAAIIIVFVMALF